MLKNLQFFLYSENNRGPQYTATLMNLDLKVLIVEERIYEFHRLIHAVWSEARLD